VLARGVRIERMQSKVVQNLVHDCTYITMRDLVEPPWYPFISKQSGSYVLAILVSV
jgi:hypothetical protein